MVKAGQVIKAAVEVQNTGTGSHTFPIGCTIRHVATNTDYNLPFQTKTISKGSKYTVTFSWTVPSGARTGYYSIIAAVWTSIQNGLGVGRLDDEVLANAFSVSA